MPATYEPIATSTLGSSANSVTFTSIPATYTDLVIVVKSNGGADTIALQFNSDTGSNYSTSRLYGEGTGAFSDRLGSWTYSIAAYVDGNGSSIMQIMNYANTTTNKHILGRGNGSSDYVFTNVGMWASTAAITSAKVYGSGGVSFSAGTTFTLYGIKAA